MKTDDWQRVLEQLHSKVDNQNYNKYFKSLSLENINHSSCVLTTKSKILKTHIEKKYKKELQSSFFEITGNHVAIDIEVSQQKNRNTLKTLLEQNLLSYKFQPNPDYNFESFMIGENNRFAYQAAKMCSEGDFISPLYIFGETSTGKTHLLHSIASQFLTRDPEKNIHYTDILSFVSQFRFAVNQRENLEKFKNQYLNYEVLIVDDIQDLTDTAVKSQEELLYIFNILSNQKKKIILAGDRPISKLSVNDKLKSRFMSGFQVCIENPKIQTRKKILNHYNKKLNLQLNSDCIDYIAENITDDVRNMLGLMNDIYLHKLTDSLLFVEKNIVESIIQNRNYRRQQVSFSEDLIIQKVCEEYSVHTKDVMGKSRKREFVLPRHISMYLLFQVYSMTKNQIAKTFQCRHTTVINAIKKIEEKLEKNPNMNKKIQLIKKLYPSIPTR